MARANNYPGGLPDEVVGQIVNQHLRYLPQHPANDIYDSNVHYAIRISSELFAKDEQAAVDTHLLEAQSITDTVQAFKYEVARQFQNTLEALAELNQMFEYHKISGKREGVVCWTEYGLANFKQFYPNYVRFMKGEEVDELLPRLPTATAIIGAEQSDTVSLPLGTVRRTIIDAPARAGGSYRKVPKPSGEEIESGKLTGLESRDNIPEDILLSKIEDEQQEQLNQWIQEFDRSLKSPNEEVDFRTLRVSDTRHYLDMPPGYAQHVKADTIREFKEAVLREAGAKIAGTRELRAMFSSVRSESQVSSTTGAPIFTWTEQGLHKFQVFLYKHFKERKIEAPTTADSPATGTDDGNEETAPRRHPAVLGSYGYYTHPFVSGVTATCRKNYHHSEGI